MAPMPPQTPAQPDSGAEVSKAAQSALQSLAILFDAVHQQSPDSPIAGAVQDLMKATSEVKRHIMSVGPDLQEGTPDDTAPESAPPAAEGDMPESESPYADEAAAEDPGPMGPGPFAAAGRGMNQALLDAAKRKQP